MSSFLNRLKAKKVIPTTPEDEKKEKLQAQASTPTPDAAALAAEQLKVDIYQTKAAIIIYTQIAGAGVNDYSVTIDGEGDTVTIRGERKRPNGEFFESKDHEEPQKENILEECSWGKFYRQIILPAEVDAEKTEAKMREGVLMLLLPLKGSAEKGLRIPVKQV